MMKGVYKESQTNRTAAVFVMKITVRPNLIHLYDDFNENFVFIILKIWKF